MKKLTFVSIAVVLAAGKPVLAHCEVPCGIYGDQQRFEAMLEDHATIAKAMDQVRDLAGKNDAQSFNQAARWVATKEEHATKIQHVIAQYFMTQRIKPTAAGDTDGGTKYVERLTRAHAVLLAAMKCKQTVDASAADALRASILSFYEAYEGKKAAPHDK